MQWLERIVNDESTNPLQVPPAYVQGITTKVTDYSRRIANDNARRAQTLSKISSAAQEKSSRRAREHEFHRRWQHATKGEDSIAMASADDEHGPELDEISQLAAQVRQQALRHSVDGALPLDSNVGSDMMNALSQTQSELTEKPATRSTVFRKKRTDSTVQEPAQTFYTVKQVASDPTLRSLSASSELSFAGGSGNRRKSGRRKGRSRSSLGHNSLSFNMGSFNSTINSSVGLPQDHIEKLERQRASIRQQREFSRRHAAEARKKLAEQDERSRRVVRDWLRKQKDVNKQKQRPHHVGHRMGFTQSLHCPWPA